METSATVTTSSAIETSSTSSFLSAMLNVAASPAGVLNVNDSNVNTNHVNTGNVNSSANDVNSIIDRMLNIGFTEEVRAGNPLAGLFLDLSPNIPFREAMNQMLTKCTPGQISDKFKRLLEISVELAMDCAMEDIYSNPAVAAAGMTVDEVAAIKIYTMASNPAES
eukprot:gene36926-48175_t